jgi:hypothetical protein
MCVCCGIGIAAYVTKAVDGVWSPAELGAYCVATRRSAGLPRTQPFDKQPGTACSEASSVWCYQASVVLSCFFPAEQCGGWWGLLDMCLSPLCKCTAGDCVTRQKAAQT